MVSPTAQCPIHSTGALGFGNWEILCLLGQCEWAYRYNTAFTHLHTLQYIPSHWYCTWPDMSSRNSQRFTCSTCRTCWRDVSIRVKCRSFRLVCTLRYCTLRYISHPQTKEMLKRQSNMLLHASGKWVSKQGHTHTLDVDLWKQSPHTPQKGIGRCVCVCVVVSESQGCNMKDPQEHTWSCLMTCT